MGKNYTNPILCGHCGVRSALEVTGSFSALIKYREEEYHQWDEGYIYDFCKCLSCTETTIRRYYWHDHMEDQEDLEIQFEILYPHEHHQMNGMPVLIEKAYLAAKKVRKIDVNAYAVLLGRVLELICEDRNAEGDTLHLQLKSLYSKNEIPENLVEVAHGLRQLRNVGAHASLGELTTEEIPVLDNLTKAIIEYVYSAPLLAKEAVETFNRLKIKKQKN